MTEKETLNLHILLRKKYNLLTEMSEVTQRIGESIDRKDQVVLVKYLSERHGILHKLTVIQGEIKASYENESKDEIKRIKALLKGKGHGNDKEEALRKQALAVEEVYSQVVELDKRVNVRIAGKDSIYSHR